MTFTIRYEHFEAKLSTALLLKRCAVSGNRIWFKPAYKITASYKTKNGHVNKNTLWMTSNEYIIWSIRSNAG